MRYWVIDTQDLKWLAVDRGLFSPMSAIARQVVLDLGWQTLRWSVIRNNFPRSARRAANTMVAYAVAAGIVRGLAR